MGGASAVAGGQLPLYLMLCPSPRLPPVVMKKKFYVLSPFDPSRPLLQRRVYVKIHEMCENTVNV